MSFEGYGGGFPSNGQQEVQHDQDPGSQGNGAPGQDNVSQGQGMPFPPADVGQAMSPSQAGPGGDQKTTLW